MQLQMRSNIRVKFVEMSYDEIRRIYRLEKNTSKLVEIDDGFFDSLNEFVKSQKEDYIKNLRDFSVAKAIDFPNLKKMIEEIFLLRQKKLMNYALIVSRTGEMPSQSMSVQEKKTFDKLLSVVNDHKSLLQDIFDEPKKNQKKGKDLNKVSVRILKDIPSFVGSDMEEYGPFTKDSTAELPYK